MRIGVLALLLLPSLQEPKPLPPLLVLRELNDARAAAVRREMEAAFLKAGFRLALLTRALADDAAVGSWLEERAKEEPFDPSRVVVFGFSAAGVEASKLALAHPKRFAGAVLAAALEPVPAGADLKAAAPLLPVLLAYGETDTTAPPRIGEQARTTLEGAGFACDWRLEPKADHFGVLRQGAGPMAEWAATAAWCVSRLRRAEALAAAGRKADAKKLLDEIQKTHPKTRFAAQAKKRAAALR